jgi:Prealbumin-like fold domain
MRLLRISLAAAVVAYGAVLAFSLGSFGTSSSSAYGYNEAELTVIKHVVNDNGGTAVASDFTMTINGVVAEGGNSFPGSETGTVKLIEAGSYNVTETGPSGYIASFSQGCSRTLDPGQSATCTVTNDDVGTIKATGSGAAGGVSFDLSFKSSNGQLSGTCTVSEARPKNKIRCLNVIQGDATINGAGTTYTITVEDHGTPGVGHDTFSVDTASGYHRSGVLTSGNITIQTS